MLMYIFSGSNKHDNDDITYHQLHNWDVNRNLTNTTLLCKITDAS